ncbi:MAG: aminotransferase class I/II-fold pyridoxal phosphate-dependent enzyme [Acidimicrobiales bacterium]
MTTDPHLPETDLPGTTVIHADRDARKGALVPPIVQAVTFTASTSDEFLEAANRTFTDDFYTRYGNPNHSQVAEVVGALEGAERAVVTASGMSALSTLALSLLESGDHVVLQRTVYPGTTSLVTGLLQRFGVTASFIEQGDVATLAGALTPRTRLVLLESPSNPLLDVTDLRTFSELAHDRGALVVVDNTLATPINQLPLALGADLVWHSATKYLSGHSDVSAGVIAGRADLIERIWHTHLVLGGVLGPFDAWLLLRGLRTLDVRMARHNENAQALATALQEHPDVLRVYYPGLPSHPQHDLARSQMSGFGGLLSFTATGGAPRAERLLDELRLTARAASLGSVHSIATRPAAMWSNQRAYDMQHSSLDEGLIRLSVGIEATADLLDDFAAALKSSGS